MESSATSISSIQTSTEGSEAGSYQDSVDLRDEDPSPKSVGGPAHWIWDLCFDKIPDPTRPGEYLARVPMGTSGLADRRCKEFDTCQGYKRLASVEWAKKHALNPRRHL